MIQHEGLSYVWRGGGQKVAGRRRAGGGGGGWRGWGSTRPQLCLVLLPETHSPVGVEGAGWWWVVVVKGGGGRAYVAVQGSYVC